MRSRIYGTDIILGHWASTQKGICKSYIFSIVLNSEFFGVIWFSLYMIYYWQRLCVEVKDFYPSYLLRVNSIKFIGNISSPFEWKRKKTSNAYAICIPLCIYVLYRHRVSKNLPLHKIALAEREKCAFDKVYSGHNESRKIQFQFESSLIFFLRNKKYVCACWSINILV